MTCWINSWTLVTIICPLGPGEALADMIQDSVRLVGVAGTENCKDQCADCVKTKEEKLVDELILDCG
jgi:hypothetical protein